MRSTLNLRVWFGLLFLLLPLCVSADGFTRGVFQLFDASFDNQYEFIAKYPAKIDGQQQILWPKGCRTLQHSRYQSDDTTTRTYLFQCEEPLSRGDAIIIPYKLDAAIFELQLGQWQSTSIVTSGRSVTHLILPSRATSHRGLPDVAAEYLLQGVMHIWFGWDHLAFVFCLCILACGFRNLFWTITAFTVGHSISMALSFLKLVSIAIPPIEAIIALSIVLIAREAWLGMNKQHKTGQLKMLVLVVLFGLIHGLGFASALDAIGVAANERILALAFFNLGVETGQIVFVATVLALLAVLRKIEHEQTFTRVALLFVGSIACFWTIERISNFGWTTI
ncbi:MAG: hydrogenase/urease accessory protein HupE [Paraglaciecola sp.]|jgi:hydrogenase/urease accessory protein HupE